MRTKFNLKNLPRQFDPRLNDFRVLPAAHGWYTLRTAKN
jgi:hypothetical protein